MSVDLSITVGYGYLLSEPDIDIALKKFDTDNRYELNEILESVCSKFRPHVSYACFGSYYDSNVEMTYALMLNDYSYSSDSRTIPAGVILPPGMLTPLEWDFDYVVKALGELGITEVNKHQYGFIVGTLWH